MSHEVKKNRRSRVLARLAVVFGEQALNAKALETAYLQIQRRYDQLCGDVIAKSDVLRVDPTTVHGCNVLLRNVKDEIKETEAEMERLQQDLLREMRKMVRNERLLKRLTVDGGEGLA
jgi:hypothetical protein